MLLLFFGISICSHFVFAQYELMEGIPGIDKGAETDFPTYIQTLYNFAIGFVVIAALLMVTIGGFYYITSAGNQSQAGTAKKIITDALLGLVVVFITWLVLYTINPTLLNADPSADSLQSGSTSTASTITATSTTHSDARVIQAVTASQTYCGTSGGGIKCYNSLAECGDSGATNCDASQNIIAGSSAYQKNEDGSYTEYENMTTCSQLGGDGCISGQSLKAQKYYNANTSTDVVEELNDAGVEVEDSVKADLGKMTQKTVDTVKEFDGTVTKVETSGVQQVDMKGGTNDGWWSYLTTVPGTTTSEDTTIKNLKQYAQDSSDGMVTVMQEESTDGNTTSYRYEFSPDYPNTNLAGTVATYNITKVLGAENYVIGEKHSDVTITAAQSITQ